VNEGWKKVEEDETKHRSSSKRDTKKKKNLHQIEEEYSSDGGYDRSSNENTFRDHSHAST
jgi:hypothetical protein